ncbi:gene transfer agent family protein [Kaistia geumhonensis]|uniref:Gene transfer agent family protein n=1 Tax=Kaistia geumhonensis TaxID=410839 RepID=A0ABU0M5X1_9HYPH|nr:gene transfer agent family protein [Kaistia geumhonensis]MCX5478450.1 gene transfer agent family protein [Kaistia geumhonensis]MDQ0516332.1 hypothetical protein [Kaistia geumhonensis]
MSRSGAIEIAWNGGTHSFRLAIRQWVELQEECGIGPPELLSRLGGSRWRVQDVRQPIRLGLVGGGMKPADANILVARYVDERPLIEAVPVAQAIVLASLVGVPDEPVGKEAAAGAATEADATDASPSPPITDPAPPWGSPPAMSTT